MKALFFAMVFAGANASAEWIQLGSARGNEFDHFIKIESIRKDGDIRNALVLFNYNESESDEKSRVASKEYDCNLKKHRTNFLITYTGHMATGKGEVLTSPSKNLEIWNDAQPLTVADAVMKIVCGSESEMPILKS